MRKVKYIILVLLVLITTDVYAASASISTSKSSVYVGDTFTVNAVVRSAASWNVHVTPSGPVSGCTIHAADSSSMAINVDNTFSATCTATGAGTITLTLSGDASDESDDRATPVSGSTSVRVTTRPAPSSNTNTNTNTNTNSNTSYRPSTNTYTPSNNITNNTSPLDPGDNKSTNTKLKSITIDNQKVEKIDENNYKVTVNNNIETIVIKAEAEDSKSTIEGAGKKELNVGENAIQIIVTSESGAQNVYNLIVTRKDAFYIEDLNSLLSDTTISAKSLVIKKDTKLSLEDLNSIADSGKLVYLNYIDEAKKPIYTWILDGTSITYAKEFLTTVEYGSANNKNVLKAANYASGINILFGKNIPENARFKIYLKDAFSKGEKPNLYFYNESTKKMQLIDSDIDTEEDYIEIDNPKTGYYFISLSKINNVEAKQVVEKVDYYLISTVILLVILASFVVFHFVRESKKSRKIKELEEEIDELEEEITPEAKEEQFEAVSAPETQLDTLAQETEEPQIEVADPQDEITINKDENISDVTNEEFNTMFENNIDNNTAQDEMPALNIDEVKPANKE